MAERVRVRVAGGVATLTGVVSIVAGGFILLGAAAAAGVSAEDKVDAGALVAAAVAGVALFAIGLRALNAGFLLSPGRLVVRSVFWSRSFDSGQLAAVAIRPTLRRRAAMLAAVSTDGEIVSCGLAAWRMRSEQLQESALHAASLADAWLGPLPELPASVRDSTLEHPAAFTAMGADGVRLVPVPALRPAEDLAPANVAAPEAQPARRLLGLETALMAVAFVLPATASAIVILARHVDRISDLDVFDLPLPDRPLASFFLMLLLYVATGVFAPLALLLLARTGQSPRSLGLSRTALRRDLLPALGLLLGAWGVTGLVTTALSPLFDDALSNQSHDTHVPAYFVIYGLVLAAVTAVNEEVVVNGYLLTRLAQLGWRPWPALGLSLALRTSYHVYYGAALLATVPIGYFVSRSFQKHRRLGRPIIVHFVYDAVLLTVAVLAS